MMNGNWRIRGDIAPWALGVTLGLLLGVALLIFANATATPPATEEGVEAAPVAEVVADDNVEAAPAVEEDVVDTEAVAVDEGLEADVVEADAVDAADTLATDPPADAEVGSEVSDEVGSEETIVNVGDVDPEAGHAVFATNCAACHGPEAGGGLGPSLQALGHDWSVAELATALREGKTPTGATLGGAMPIFSAEQIGDQEVANIHAWLATK